MTAIVGDGNGDRPALSFGFGLRGIQNGVDVVEFECGFGLHGRVPVGKMMAVFCG